MLKVPIRVCFYRIAIPPHIGGFQVSETLGDVANLDQLPAPCTWGWLAAIWCTSVVPERGIPTMNTGRSERTPQSRRCWKNSGVNICVI